MAKLIQLQDVKKEPLYPKQYYPIGWILQSYCNINPSTFCIGTWELTSKGKVLVGIDTNQEEFNEIKKIGGEKTHSLIPEENGAHTHGLHFRDNGATGGNGGSDVGAGGGMASERTYPDGEGRPHNNLQPYITCYYWERIN